MTTSQPLVSVYSETAGPLKPVIRQRQPAENMFERNRMVEAYMPLVRRLCWRFRSSGELLEDLIQIGNVGLIKAINKYDPALQTNFVSYAIPVILGEIRNYFRDHGWAVKVSRNLQRQRLAVNRSIESLTQLLGRSPTISEIAESISASEEEVLDTIELNRCGNPLSLDALIGNVSDVEGPSLLDYLGSEDPHLSQTRDKIVLTVATECLTKREKIIIHLKFYAGKSQTQIAERLGISQMHVSRLQRNALKKLKLQLMP